MCKVMNVYSVQQCLTGARGSKRVGAGTGMPQLPTPHYRPRYTCQSESNDVMSSLCNASAYQRTPWHQCGMCASYRHTSFVVSVPVAPAAVWKKGRWVFGSYCQREWVLVFALWYRDKMQESAVETSIISPTKESCHNQCWYGDVGIVFWLLWASADRLVTPRHHRQCRPL